MRGSRGRIHGFLMYVRVWVVALYRAWCLRRDGPYLLTYLYKHAQLPPAAATMKHFIGYGNSRNG